MNIQLNGFTLDLQLRLRLEDKEYAVSPVEKSPGEYHYKDETVSLLLAMDDSGEYRIDMTAARPASVKIMMELLNEEDHYHLIPCNIHGDNNLKNAKPGFFPNLTEEFPEYDTSSTEWEFRADRASHPVSIITCSRGAVGISMDPYSKADDNADGFIRNGLVSQLPASAGVSLGYRNFPCTFTSKENMTESTGHLTAAASASGKIYAFTGKERTITAAIIKDLYNRYRECPTPTHSANEYLAGFLDSYENVNWSSKDNAFTNEECRIPDDPELKPWRPLIATGWTGTGVLVYPLLSAQILLDRKDSFTDKLFGLFDEMSGRINPATGLFFDLIRPWKGSDVNGWWAGYIVKDCHCAYSNGHGIYYLLKTYQLLKEKTGATRDDWLAPALTALDSILGIQRDDGCFGYTYPLDEPRIDDPDGFAGCWFSAALAVAHILTGEKKYLDGAEKGMEFYYSFVKNLDCWGAPMDTWKSIDQEGNLAFIKAAVNLHKATGDDKYLDMAVHGAEYEYLWRYAYKARPEFAPLKDSRWNSCGGSITSVSNPHIHPMGVNVTAELFYIYRQTGDGYHFNRAVDGLYWGLATADLYPDVTGYGRLGVITERYCPSDGLTIERFSDTDEPSSIWFTFNGWAGVSILEGLTETLLTADADEIIKIIDSLNPEEKI